MAYWVAYRLLYIWWFLARPRHKGASVAVWHQGQLLVVRHSYQRGLFLPGGGVQRGETAQEAALRELREEVGLSVPAASLRLRNISSAIVAFRRDEAHIFELDSREAPSVRIDGREIVEARFVSPASLKGVGISPHLENYLQAIPTA